MRHVFETIRQYIRLVCTLAVLCAPAILCTPAWATTFFGNPKVTLEAGADGPVAEDVSVDVDKVTLHRCGPGAPVDHLVDDILKMDTLDSGQTSPGDYCHVTLETASLLEVWADDNGTGVQFLLSLDGVGMSLVGGPSVPAGIEVNLRVSSWLTATLVSDVAANGLVVDSSHPNHAVVQALARAAVATTPY